MIVTNISIEKTMRIGGNLIRWQYKEIGISMFVKNYLLIDMNFALGFVMSIPIIWVQFLLNKICIGIKQK